MAIACETESTTPLFEFVVARDASNVEALVDPSSLLNRDCPVRHDLPTFSIKNSLGWTTSLWTAPDTRFRLTAAPREVILTKHPNSAGVEIVAARVRFSEIDQGTLVEFRERFKECQILVSLNGEPLWLTTNRSDWSVELPIGILETGSASYNALVDGDSKILWADWPELDAALRATESSRRRSINMLACDGEFRAEFERKNPGALELLADSIAAVECTEIDESF